MIRFFRRNILARIPLYVILSRVLMWVLGHNTGAVLDSMHYTLASLLTMSYCEWAFFSKPK